MLKDLDAKRIKAILNAVMNNEPVPQSRDDEMQIAATIWSSFSQKPIESPRGWSVETRILVAGVLAGMAGGVETEIVQVDPLSSTVSNDGLSLEEILTAVGRIATMVRPLVMRDA